MSQQFHPTHQDPFPCTCKASVTDKPAAATANAKPNHDVRPEPAKLLLMVGLPGAGKTTRAEELAAAHRALRLTRVRPIG